MTLPSDFLESYDTGKMIKENNNNNINDKETGPGDVSPTTHSGEMEKLDLEQGK